MDESIRDMLLQLIIICLIFAAFFVGVKNAADPDGFFLRFYAEDVGTVVEALHAANGAVELDYTSLHPAHPLVFDILPDRVRLATTTNSTNWRAGHIWGVATEPAVRPVTLDAPAMLGFDKHGALLTVNEAPGRCVGAIGTFGSSRLVLQSTQMFRDLLESRPVIRDWLGRSGTPVTLTIAAGDAAIIHSQTPEAEGLACLLEDELAVVLGSVLVTAGTGTDITLTVRIPPTAAAAGAVARALERAGG